MNRGTTLNSVNPDRGMSDLYNTVLSPEELKNYGLWLQKHNLGADPVYDYDMMGAFKAGAGQADNGHFTDQFKKPNHPTFSTESQYSGQNGLMGGQWSQMADGRWMFTPGPTNMSFFSPQALREYFNRVEPDSQLVFPHE